MTIAKEPYFLTNSDWSTFNISECRYVLTEEATEEARKSYEEFYSLIEKVGV